MMMHNPIKYGWKKIISSVDVVKTVISDYISPHCDPELEDSKPIFLHDTVTLKIANNFFFPMTLWLMMLHHHTKLGYKMFSSSEDIIRTNIDILYLCCNLDLECSRKRTRKLYSPMDDERRHKHTSAFDTKSSSG